ncbi:oxygen-independent coproporphyrinogen III oxidase [Mangrovimicrobium sediminis]|uniref:Coproporphyrinogen-III oxidase n=1 Tax=Mangrovimicrobium sediminis TaxID=2562682 RepID=A0A4Z0M512_9GAMM|nr:oxygen-independent coproporphyrinogen III oxidase [Haliea sp. SAOS-164]TGD74564.1 oxygen-independent coproporphyrinogen III oxidase [Haliea sp. SAOS-164]
MTIMIANTAGSPSLPAELAEDVALARKYACQGPRYTSYPTAPQFSTEFPLADYLAGQRAGAAHNREPLSLYVHVPFCNDICYYCACNKIVTRRKNVARTYLDHLQREIVAQAELVGRERPITQMHWGGGTPTYLDHAQITELMHLLASNFRLLDKNYREYSIEIDPRTVDNATLALLKGVGFNRISLGVQDFDEQVQKAVNRIQPYEQVAGLVDSVRNLGFRSLSFDLIYGLPFQDRDSIARTVQQVIALSPDRIACYNYAHLPERFSSQRAIDRLALPAPEEKLLLHEIISHTLKDAGYQHIGMDHYVLPGDELALAQAEGRLQRNFQGYSLRMADDLVGLGVSAISQMGDYYLQNARDLETYYQRVEADELAIERGCRIDEEDRLRRHVIMSLICDLHLDLDECNRQFGIDFAGKFAAELAALAPMAADGLLQLEADSIRVTARGRPFLRNICMPFDAYLPRGDGGDRPAGFSATV